MLPAPRQACSKVRQEFLKKRDVSWTNYYDEAGLTGTAFHTPGIPTMVLIDASGNVVYIGGSIDAVRREIAKLGPEYASLGATSSAPSKD